MKKEFFFQRQKRRRQDSYKRPRLLRKTNHSTNGNVLYVWIAVYGIESLFMIENNFNSY